MNWKDICTVYLKELKDQLRDRRTLISTIVIPTVAMPLMFFIFGYAINKVIKTAQAEGTSVMIIGATGAPELLKAIKADPRFHVVPEAADYKQRISEKRLRVAMELPADFEQTVRQGKEATVTVLYYDGEVKSSMGRSSLEDFLRKHLAALVENRLKERGLPAELTKPFELKRKNVAPPEKVGGAKIGGFIPYMIIILCFTGAMYPAMDLTAGEKERGTMETLMCSPTSRINIVLGKFLMVLTASVATMIFALISMGVTTLAGGMMFAGQARAAQAAAATRATAEGSAMLSIDPMGLLGLFAMIAPVAVMFAALLLAISLFAKSYKEAQSYVGPMVFVVIMPAVFGLLPGIDLSVRTALIPILNLSLVSKEMLSGTWNWHLIALIFGSSCLYAGVALAFCVKMFNRESVMFRT